MAEADELVMVHQAPAPIAELIAGVLRARGIRVAVFDTVDHSAYPGLTPQGRVMVRRADAAAARAIIDEEGNH